jgi:hypothetical protein
MRMNFESKQSGGKQESCTGGIRQKSRNEFLFQTFMDIHSVLMHSQENSYSLSLGLFNTLFKMNIPNWVLRTYLPEFCPMLDDNLE